MMLSFSYNEHEQDSRYGKTSYIASQKIGFTQLTWDKNAGNHDLLFGIALRYTYYDDNTPTTQNADMLKIKMHHTSPGCPASLHKMRLRCQRSIKYC
ncbi:MAG: hypothetical protein IPL13_07970 [Saprospiraceae bacterium]|nr:hypothetical protein [Candidatus Brachybacter algidus]